MKKTLIVLLLSLPLCSWAQTKKVSNITDFVNAMQSNTTIEVKSGFYYVADLQDKTNDNVNFATDYEGKNYLVISNIENVVIKGIGNQQPNIVSSALGEPVLKFENCTNITLENLFLGHGPAKGYCDGAALGLNNCSDVTVRNTTLFGSGSYGIMSVDWWGSSGINGLKVENTTIRGCSSGIVYIENSSNLAFSNCSFNDNSGWAGFAFRNCSNVKISDSEISYNNFVGTYDQSEQALWDVSGTKVEVTNCMIQSNGADYEQLQSNSVKLINCTNVNNAYVKGLVKQ